MVPQDVVQFLPFEVVQKMPLQRPKSGTENGSPACIYIYMCICWRAAQRDTVWPFSSYIAGRAPFITGHLSFQTSEIAVSGSFGPLELVTGLLRTCFIACTSYFGDSFVMQSRDAKSAKSKFLVSSLRGLKSFLLWLATVENLQK